MESAYGFVHRVIGSCKTPAQTENAFMWALKLHKAGRFNQNKFNLLSLFAQAKVMYMQIGLYHDHAGLIVKQAKLFKVI